MMYFTSELDKSGRSIHEASESIDAAHEIESNVLTHSRESLLWEMTYDAKHFEKRIQAQKSALSSLEMVKRYVDSPGEQDLIVSLESSIPAYFELIDTLEKSGRNPDQITFLVSPNVDAIVDDITRLIDLNKTRAVFLDQASSSAYTVANRLAVTAIFLVFLGIPLLFYQSRTRLYQPFLKVINDLRNFRRGGYIVAETKSGLAEIREMSQTVVEMISDLKNNREQQMRYLASVAHDIRNPIGAISMAVELSKSSTEPDNEVFEYLEIIGKQIGYLDQMVGDLVDITRLEAGELRLQLKLTDIRILVENAVQLFRNYSPKHRIVLHAPPEPIFCNVDDLRVSQVLNNLISNAIKYSPNGGDVDVRLDCKNGTARVSVSDYGIGISKNDLAEIFLPFRRSKRIEKTGIPGVGLGLFTAKKIVEAHSGELSVSSSPDEESTFTFSLPRQRADLGPTVNGAAVHR